MSNKIICDICQQPMQFVERVKSNKKYRIRRFKCICGYERTIFADGHMDNEVVPNWATKCVNAMYKEQNKNNEK